MSALFLPPVSRSLLQAVRSQNNTVTTTTATIPHDDTPPQNNEGLEFLTISITPTLPNSTLRIRALIHHSNSGTNDQIAIALFRDATADALCVAMANSDQVNSYTKTVLDFEAPASSTSPTTFKLRIGGQGGTININNSAQGQGDYGNKVYSFIEIVELAA